MQKSDQVHVEVAQMTAKSSMDDIEPAAAPSVVGTVQILSDKKETILIPTPSPDPKGSSSPCPQWRTLT
jgi:hypothetical protein